MKLSTLYNTYPNVLILHGITKIGAKSEIPPEKTFSERVIFAIESSNNSKLSAHSFAFRINDRRHLWSSVGVILREAVIIAAAIEDTGLTKKSLHLAWSLPKADYQTLLLGPNRVLYNELVVQQAAVMGIYIMGLTPNSPQKKSG